jgi:uncharacterized repeat protein (TIGR03803 family)
MQPNRLLLRAAAILVATLTPTMLSAQKFRIVYNFPGGAEGYAPNGGILLSNGSLYGTTHSGGDLSCLAPNGGCGVAYKLDPTTGVETVLHTFTGINDGEEPTSGFSRYGSSLYGTTLLGGATGPYYGTIYTIDVRTGAEKMLYSFLCGSYGYPCPLGSEPESNPVADARGNLYSTAASGGTYGLGVVFRFNRITHKYTLLHSFSGVDGDGSTPLTSLIMDASGNLYGTTLQGGSPDNTCYVGGNQGCGTVFKIDSNGTYSVLYAFNGATQGDGTWPYSKLVQDSAGNLYGTTLYGGTGTACGPYFGGGCGTVYKIDPSGNETVVYSFTDSNGDGDSPLSLALAPNGVLYGITNAGGDLSCTDADNGCGTVFQLDPSSGKETILYIFTDFGIASFPRDIVLDPSGKHLFGVTVDGGGAECAPGYNCGTVFELTLEN